MATRSPAAMVRMAHFHASLLLAAATVNAAAGSPDIGRNASGRPNILLMFPDELRYDWGGLHNNPYYDHAVLPIRLPHFDELAASGVCEQARLP